jgi:hypothetical protein
MQVLVFFPLMIEKQALENPVFCLHFPFSKHRTLVHMQLDLAAFLIVVQNQSAVPVADAAGSGAPAPAAAEDVMQMLFPWRSAVVAAGAGSSAAAVSSGATLVLRG